MRQYRAQRAQLLAEVSAIQSARAHPVLVPTEEEALADLARLTETFTAAACCADLEDADRVRQVIKLIVGGNIEVHQMGERKKHLGWLQLRFKTALINVFAERLTGMRIGINEATEVVIDLIPKRIVTLDKDGDRAFEMYEEGLLDIEIAKKMNCCRNRVARLLQRTAQQRGVKLLDGRARYARLHNLTRGPLKHEAIADVVLTELMKGKLISVIAEEGGWDRNLLTKAIKFLREVRGIDIPDGRTRRKSLKKKTRGYTKRKPKPDHNENGRS